MKFRLLAPALDDLEHIDAWVRSNFGGRAADKARSKLYETFAMLAGQQFAGIERPEVLAPPIRFFSSRLNWIIYEPGDPLLIHRLYPARSDLRNLEL